LRPEIYTGEFNNNLRFYELSDETHWVSAGVAAEMNVIDENMAEFFKLKNSDYDCGGK